MTRYFSGDGYGLVSGLVLALLPADTEISQLNRLWDGLSGQPELTDLLQALTSQRSKTWPGWPAFALVMREDNGGLRLVVRGACQVRVTTATGEQVFDGRSVTTWREDTVPEPLRVCLTAVDGPVDGDGLPVTGGIVRTSRLETDWTGDPLQQIAAEPSQADLKPPMDEPAAMVKPVQVPAVPSAVSSLPMSSSGHTTRLPDDSQLRLSGNHLFPRPVSAQSPLSPVAVGAEAALPVAAVAVTAVDEPDSFEPAAGDGYDYLWDDPTTFHSPEVAAVRQTEEEAEPKHSLPAVLAGDGSVDLVDDDHDGMTIMSLPPPVPDAESAVLTAASSPVLPASGPVAGSEQPTVLARICSGCGQANATRRPDCSNCGTSLSGDAVRVPRPVLGWAVISNGQSFPLDHPLVMGRRPQAPFSPHDAPHLVTVDGPDHDISRSHLRVDLEDWSVLVRDLGSTNGTVLHRPGQPDRKLHKNEPVAAVSGDIFDLGSGVTMTMRDLV